MGLIWLLIYTFIQWKDWPWSWSSNSLATWCEDPTHWKRPWCWERLRAGGEGDDRRWDGWMASLTRWTWVSVNSASWWWTGRPGVLRFMGSQRVRHNWATDLIWFQILKDDAVKVPHSICQQIWKTQQWPQDWERSVFIPIPKKDNAKECSNYRTIALISHTSK